MELLIAGIVSAIVLLIYRGVITTIVVLLVLVAGGGFWGALLAGVLVYTILTVVRLALIAYAAKLLEPTDQPK